MSYTFNEVKAEVGIENEIVVVGLNGLG